MSRCATTFRDGSTCGDRSPRRRPIDIEVTKARASERVRELCQDLLPNGREIAGHWRTGSIADDAGQSLAVSLQGPDKGMWCDYAASGPEGGGNMIQLAALVSFGGDVGKALQWLNSRLGLDDLDPSRLQRERAQIQARREDEEEAHAKAAEKKRRNAVKLFLDGVPIAGTPVEQYLRGRGILLEKLGRVPNALRFHPETYNVEAQRGLPCMLASIVDLDGRQLATHRTWLAPDGRGGWTKANLEQPKKVLGGFAGGFIPLWKGEHRQSMGQLPAGADIYVSEGIEDGLSVAMARPSVRVIAAVSLVNLGRVRLPEAMGRLFLVGQRDTHPKTLEAIERAIRSQQEAGRDVWMTPPPAGGFKDVNEALMADAGGE